MRFDFLEEMLETDGTDKITVLPARNIRDSQETPAGQSASCSSAACQGFSLLSFHKSQVVSPSQDDNKIGDNPKNPNLPSVLVIPA